MSENCRPVTGAGVWSGHDLREDPSWVWTLEVGAASGGLRVAGATLSAPVSPWRGR